jgi:hypothetical protein
MIVAKQDHDSCWGTTCWVCGGSALFSGLVKWDAIKYRVCDSCRRALEGRELSVEGARAFIALSRPVKPWKDAFAKDTRTREEARAKAYRAEQYQRVKELKK